MSEAKKKLKIFLKLRPSEMAHFEGMVSGHSNTCMIKHDIASLGLWDPLKLEKEQKKTKKSYFKFSK